jgi:hypothetical protein
LLEMKPVRNGDTAMTSAIAGRRASSTVVVPIDKRVPDRRFRLIILERSTAAGSQASEGLEGRSTFQRGRQKRKNNADAEVLLHSFAFSDTVEIKATWSFSSCITLIRPACRAAGPGESRIDVARDLATEAPKLAIGIGRPTVPMRTRIV